MPPTQLLSLGFNSWRGGFRQNPLFAADLQTGEDHEDSLAIEIGTGRHCWSSRMVAILPYQWSEL